MSLLVIFCFLFCSSIALNYDVFSKLADVIHYSKGCVQNCRITSELDQSCYANRKSNRPKKAAALFT